MKGMEVRSQKTEVRSQKIDDGGWEKPQKALAVKTHQNRIF